MLGCPSCRHPDMPLAGNGFETIRQSDLSALLFPLFNGGGVNPVSHLTASDVGFSSCLR